VAQPDPSKHVLHDVFGRLARPEVPKRKAVEQLVVGDEYLLKGSGVPIPNSLDDRFVCIRT
jgi:hypothetical protein